MLLNDALSQVLPDALEGRVNAQMLEDCEAIEDAVELRAVTDLFACLVETLGSRHIEPVDGQLTGRRVDFTSHALEESGLACAGHTKQCEALTELETEGDVSNGLDIIKDFSYAVHADRQVVWCHTFDTLLLLNDVLVNLVPLHL